MASRILSNRPQKRCPETQHSMSRRGGRNKGGCKQMRANASKRRQTQANAERRTRRRENNKKGDQSIVAQEQKRPQPPRFQDKKGAQDKSPGTTKRTTKKNMPLNIHERGAWYVELLRHVMRAILPVRPKCSHRCVSLKESPLKPVLILNHTTKNSTEQTSMRMKCFKHTNFYRNHYI